MRPQAIINSFKNKKILVIGDLILDRYLFGKAQRISPEAPVPVVEVTGESYLLGGATNVAHNIVSLGGKASLAGILGKDRAGAVMRDLLQDKGIGTEGIIEDKRPTTIKTRLIAQKQQIVRFDREDRRTLEGKNLDALLAYVRDAMPAHDAVIISDYKKGVISAALVKAVVGFTWSSPSFIAVDPKVGHFHLYRDVSLLTPNIAEASQGSGIEIKDEQSLIRAGKTLMQRLSCGSVLITRGAEGMSLFVRKLEGEGICVTHIPTAARKVFDVTGAGDTVIAAYTLSHAAGATPEMAAEIANHAAGLVVGEVGTAVATPKELLNSLLRQS